MDMTTISLIGLVITIAGGLSTAVWRIRTEAAAHLDRARSDLGAQITAANAQAMLAQARISELELDTAKHYVSKAALTESLGGLLREMESGFRNLDAKIDLLFDRAPQARPRGRGAGV